MNVPVSLKRRLAVALTRRAGQLLPTSRLDWAKAMQGELDHLGSDQDALRWAIGCVVAGTKERINSMFTVKLRVTRWILVPEMLLCFVPLTLLWLDSVGTATGIIRSNGEFWQHYFLGAPGGVYAPITLIAAAVLGTLGPLGLGAAFRLVVAGRAPSAPWFRAALIAGPAFYGVLTLAARLGMGGTRGFGFDAPDSFDFWSGILLLSALPSLAAVHMAYLPRKPYESLAAN